MADTVVPIIRNDGSVVIPIYEQTQDIVSFISKEEKDKLESLSVSGDRNVQPDWNETDDTKFEYIKNKPDLNSIPVSSVIGLQDELDSIPITMITHELRASESGDDYPKTAPYVMGSNNEDILVLYPNSDFRLHIQPPPSGLTKDLRIIVGNTNNVSHVSTQASDGFGSFYFIEGAETITQTGWDSTYPEFSGIVETFPLEDTVGVFVQLRLSTDDSTPRAIVTESNNLGIFGIGLVNRDWTSEDYPVMYGLTGAQYIELDSQIGHVTVHSIATTTIIPPTTPDGNLAMNQTHVLAANFNGDIAHIELGTDFAIGARARFISANNSQMLILLPIGHIFINVPSALNMFWDGANRYTDGNGDTIYYYLTPLNFRGDTVELQYVGNNVWRYSAYDFNSYGYGAIPWQKIDTSYARISDLQPPSTQAYTITSASDHFIMVNTHANSGLYPIKVSWTTVLSYLQQTMATTSQLDTKIPRTNAPINRSSSYNSSGILYSGQIERATASITLQLELYTQRSNGFQFTVMAVGGDVTINDGSTNTICPQGSYAWVIRDETGWQVYVH